MLRTRAWIACLPLLLCAAACDDASGSEDKSATAEAEAAPAVGELELGKTAASFQLQAVTELVQGKTVSDPKALEAKINDPESKLAAVDLDEDGTADFIEVIEEGKGDDIVLKFRAVPSSKKDKDPKKVGVVIASIELHLKPGDDDEHKKIVVHGVYEDVLIHEPHHVYHHEHVVVVTDGVLVLEHGCFFHHLYLVEHEHYHGHFHYLVIIDDHHHYKHKKHKKHKKFKGHKGHKGKHHGW